MAGHVGDEHGDRPGGSSGWPGGAGRAPAASSGRRGPRKAPRRAGAAARRSGGTRGRRCGRHGSVPDAVGLGPRRGSRPRCHVPTSRKTSSSETVRSRQATDADAGLDRRRRGRASWAVAERRRSGGLAMMMREPSRAASSPVEDEPADDLVGPLVDLDAARRGPAPVSSCDRCRWRRPGPRARMTAASQIRSTSSSRCDDTHDVDAELGADAADERQHVVALHGVEAVGGLVEQHQVGVVGDGLGQLHPLALPGGHGADGAEALLAEPDRPEGVARPVGGVAAGAGRGPGRCGGRGRGRWCRAGGGGARGSSRCGRARRRRPRWGRGPRTCERAVVGPVQPEHQPEQGGLAGAVGAEQAR